MHNKFRRLGLGVTVLAVAAALLSLKSFADDPRVLTETEKEMVEQAKWESQLAGKVTVQLIGVERPAVIEGKFKLKYHIGSAEFLVFEEGTQKVVVMASQIAAMRVTPAN